MRDQRKPTPCRALRAIALAGVLALTAAPWAHPLAHGVPDAGPSVGAAGASHAEGGGAGECPACLARTQVRHGLRGALSPACDAHAALSRPLHAPGTDAGEGRTLLAPATPRAPPRSA